MASVSMPCVCRDGNSCPERGYNLLFAITVENEKGGCTTGEAALAG